MAEKDGRKEPAVNVTAFVFRTIVAGVLIVVLLKVFVFSGERHWAGESRGPVPNPSASPAGVAGAAQAELDGPRGQTAFELKEARARAAVQIAKFRELCTETEATVRLLEGAIREWESQTSALLSGEEGKQLAASPEAVSEFKALIDVPRPGKAVVERLRMTCLTLKAPVEEAARDPNNSASPDKSILELQAAFDEATKGFEEYRDALVAINRLKLTPPASAPAEFTLADAIERATAEKAKAHALALKKVADDAQAAKEQKEIEEAKDLTRRAAIARDPKALKLLDFLAMDPDRPGHGVYAALLAEAYKSPAAWEQLAIERIGIQIGSPNRTIVKNTPAINEYNRRNSLSKQQFGLSMHELFKVVIESEANQKLTASDELLEKKISSLQDKGDKQTAARFADVLSRGAKLPKPKYP